MAELEQVGLKADAKLENLEFLRAFMVGHGLSIEEVAGQVGVTRQALYSWFRCDDAKISAIENLFDVLGFRVSFGIKTSARHGKALVIEDPKGYVPTSAAEDNSVQSRCKRLAFMNKAMKARSLSQGRVAEAVGRTNVAVFSWFKQDDCLVSYAYKVAELCEAELVVGIERK